MQTWDFIVVGAGSAGAAAAARLSENGKHTVLLLEPGEKTDSINHRLPLAVVKLVSNPKWSWRFVSGPEKSLGGHMVYSPRGLGLGGSSAINGMIWAIGDASEYDHWRQLGNEGWGWRDVQPFFKRIETYKAGDAADRGQDGPITITKNKPDALGDAFLASARQLGIPAAADYNNGNIEGYTYLQTNTRNGWRVSTYEGYLKPAMRRANLHVMTGRGADRLIFEGRRVVGVEHVSRDGDRQVARAAREVIVCAGAYHSPALLERSGVGRPEVLQALGIDVRHDMPHVGENMRDHLRSAVTYRTKGALTVNDITHGLIPKMRAGLQFMLFRRGWLRTSTMNSQLTTRSSDLVDRADLKVQLNAISNDFSKRGQLGYPVDKVSGISLLNWAIYPRSTGRVHITGTSPWDKPNIRTNFLSDSYDQAVSVAGLRLARRLAAQPAFAPYIVSETFPGVNIDSDEELLAYAKGTGLTVYHPIATCRMGRAGESVVDTQLRVHGLDGIRIADASIFPTMPAANTNAAAIMTGERVAQFALDAAR